MKLRPLRWYDRFFMGLGLGKWYVLLPNGKIREDGGWMFPHNAEQSAKMFNSDTIIWSSDPLPPRDSTSPKRMVLDK